MSVLPIFHHVDLENDTDEYPALAIGINNIVKHDIIHRLIIAVTLGYLYINFS